MKRQSQSCNIGPPLAPKINDERARDEWDRAAGDTRSFHWMYDRHNYDHDDPSLGERGRALGYLSQRKWYKYSGTPEGERLLGMNLKDCNSGASDRQDRFRTLMSHTFTLFVELSQSSEIVVGDHKRCAIAHGLEEQSFTTYSGFMKGLKSERFRQIVQTAWKVSGSPAEGEEATAARGRAVGRGRRQ